MKFVRKKDAGGEKKEEKNIRLCTLRPTIKDGVFETNQNFRSPLRRSLPLEKKKARQSR